jgi:hypothetical protein
LKRHHLLATLLVTQLGLGALGQQPSTPNVGFPPAPRERPLSQQIQKPDSEDVVRITTNLVQVDAVVTDKNGKVLTDLKPDEIRIMEDGRLQKITNFSYNVTESPPSPPALKNLRIHFRQKATLRGHRASKMELGWTRWHRRVRPQLSRPRPVTRGRR